MKSKPETNPNPGDPIEQPGKRPDFQPRFYPTANGRKIEEHKASVQNLRFMEEFLAIYYDLNLGYARLQKCRAEANSVQRKEAEKKCLQDMERLLKIRDSLEDKLAPLGVIAEPVVQNGITVDVSFTFGNVDASGRRRADWFTIAACVPIPMPPGSKFEDLPIQIKGPWMDPQ